MKKMTTLFVQNFEPVPSGKGRIFTGLSEEVRPENAWVFTDPSVKAYRKLDGTAAAIIDGVIYARYMVRHRKGNKPPIIPENGIPAQPNKDEGSNSHPYWVPAHSSPHYKYHVQAFEKQPGLPDGTYELCGTKINGNKEGLDDEAFLWNHDDENLLLDMPYPLTFDSIKVWISSMPYEGVVFKNDSGQTCKIRRVDFQVDY